MDTGVRTQPKGLISSGNLGRENHQPGWVKISTEKYSGTGKFAGTPHTIPERRELSGTGFSPWAYYITVISSDGKNPHPGKTCIESSAYLE